MHSFYLIYPNIVLQLLLSSENCDLSWRFLTGRNHLWTRDKLKTIPAVHTVYRAVRAGINWAVPVVAGDVVEDSGRFTLDWSRVKIRRPARAAHAVFRHLSNRHDRAELSGQSVGPCTYHNRTAYDFDVFDKTFIHTHGRTSVRYKMFWLFGKLLHRSAAEKVDFPSPFCTGIRN